MDGASNEGWEQRFVLWLNGRRDERLGSLDAPGSADLAEADGFLVGLRRVLGVHLEVDPHVAGVVRVTSPSGAP